jgi:hypothetical protein
MTYAEFEKYMLHHCKREAFYNDSEGRDILVIRMLDAYEMVTKAPRSWVGLTDEEIKALPSWWPSYEDAPALIALVRDVEAKLRLKNTK